MESIGLKELVRLLESKGFDVTVSEGRYLSLETFIAGVPSVVKFTLVKGIKGRGRVSIKLLEGLSEVKMHYNTLMSRETSIKLESYVKRLLGTYDPLIDISEDAVEILAKVKPGKMIELTKDILKLWDYIEKSKNYRKEHFLQIDNRNTKILAI